jgi:serine/threonine-protein kinase
VADAELALANRLDAIRQRRWTIIEGVQFDFRPAAQDYAGAFGEAGLGKVGDNEAAVAARIRDSGVEGQLVAALDDWASVTKEPKSRAWLFRVARLAAPDPWRNRFRDPAVWEDRQALQAVVDEALRDDGAKLNQLSPEVLNSLGMLLGGGVEVVPLLNAAHRRYPNDFWLSLSLGAALGRVKKYEEAVSFFRAAVALRRDAVAAHHNLGLALYHKNDLDGAIAECRQVISLAPKHRWAHKLLSIVLLANGDRDGAIAEGRRAIDLDPKDAKAHYNLGLALRGKDLDSAIAEYRRAVDLDPKDAKAHFNLGLALYDNMNMDGAVAEFRETIELHPEFAADAHNGLGLALHKIGHMDEAISEYRKAIELRPKDAKVHLNLGLALHGKDLDSAIAEYRRAIDLDPKDAKAHYSLGVALQELGNFTEASTAKRRTLELLPRRDPWYQLAAQQLEQCERLAALDQKLWAVLKGEAEPAGAAERLALGQLCWQYKHRYAAAARFCADAFAADPKLADDLRRQHRYNAACSAARAAAGEGEDARQLPDKAVVMFRRWALGWLHEDLAQYAKLTESGESAARQLVRIGLGHWLEDTDLAGLRDPAALAKLPEAEREAWLKLWAEVDTLLRRAKQDR